KDIRGPTKSVKTLCVFMMILLRLAPPRRQLLPKALLLISACGLLRASGSYMVRPVHPPAQVVRDSEKYELGKAVFLGKATITDQAGSDKASQRVRLIELQERLPARVRKTVDLAALSGRLSAEQFAALQHFLKVRHKIE